MDDGDLWVFGYGSLIWHPGFDFIDKRPARLQGYRRSFCMSSVHYRGTPERPGLVLALDREVAGACQGVAYRVPGQSAEDVIAYLRDRELVSYAYEEARLPIVLAGDDSEIEAITYVTNRTHAQYRGGLSLEDQADVIAHAAGSRGRNADYLINTVESLMALGLEDAELLRLADLVRARLSLSSSA